MTASVSDTPTLDTPVRDWTNQQVFDFVAEHLIQQGRKSVNDNGDCQYRGRDDLKCAIGALIPDDRYRKSMEGGSVQHLPEEIKRLLGADSKGRLELLDALQEAHDSCDLAFDETKSRLVTVAIPYCLSTAAFSSQVPA